MSFIEKVEEYVNVPLALRVVGVLVLGLTVWKGVHGFWPTFGAVAGGLLLFVGGHYSKLHR